MKISVNIPNENCTKCICCDFAENKRGTRYRICRAYNRILTITINGLGDIVRVNRCPECIAEATNDETEEAK